MTTETETTEQPQISATVIGVELLPASMLPELPELPIEMAGQTATLGNNLDALRGYGVKHYSRYLRSMAIVETLLRDGWTGTVGPRHVLLHAGYSRDGARERLTALGIGAAEVQWVPTDEQLTELTRTGEKKQ